MRMAAKIKSHQERPQQSVLVKYDLTEEDFYMAIIGAQAALEKMTRPLMIEIKHLKNLNHLSMLHDLMQISYLLKGEVMPN